MLWGFLNELELLLCHKLFSALASITIYKKLIINDLNSYCQEK